jgi:hypothetical protein
MNKIKDLENKTQGLETKIHEIMVELSNIKKESNIEHLKDYEYINQKYYTDAKEYIGVMIPISVIFDIENAEYDEEYAIFIPVYFDFEWAKDAISDILGINPRRYLNSNQKLVPFSMRPQLFCTYREFLRRAQMENSEILCDMADYIKESKCIINGKGMKLRLKDCYKNVIKPIPDIYPYDNPVDVFLGEFYFRKHLKPNACMSENTEGAIYDILKITLDYIQNDPIFARGISPQVFEEIKKDEDTLMFIWNNIYRQQRGYLLRHTTVNASYSGFNIEFLNLNKINSLLSTLEDIFKEKFDYKLIREISDYKLALRWVNKFELVDKIINYYNDKITDKKVVIDKLSLAEDKIDALADMFMDVEFWTPALYIYEGLYGEENISKPSVKKHLWEGHFNDCEYYLKDEIAKLVKLIIDNAVEKQLL